MMESKPGLEIHTLGGVRFVLDGELVDQLSTRKVQGLAIYLAVKRRPQPREVLADLMWDDRSQTRALSNLRVALSNLRKHLGPYYRISRENAAINPDAGIWLDVERLEAGLAKGHSGKEHKHSATVETIERALALYEGSFLQGFSVRGARLFEDWSSLERERLHQLVTDGYAQVVEWYLGSGKFPAGIQHAKLWLQHDPLNEAAHQDLMRLLAYNGQSGTAIRQYQECVQLLDEELGLEPSPKTTELYEAIRTGHLLPPAEDALTVFQASQPAAVQLPGFLEQDVDTEKVAGEPFTGREQEIAFLLNQLRKTKDKKGSVTFVTGEAGMGKTTLLREFARQAQLKQPDLVIASAASPPFSGVSSPYAIFRDILAMLTADVMTAFNSGAIGRNQAAKLVRLLPDVLPILFQKGRDLLGTMIQTGELIQRATMAAVDPILLSGLDQLEAQTGKQRSYLSNQGELFAEFSAVLKSLSTRQPVLLILDDLHWLDPASIGLLGYLGHQLEEMGIMMVGAYRPEEVEQGREDKPHPLLPILGEFRRRYGNAWLVLDEPTAGGGRIFVDSYLDSEPNNLDEEFRKNLTRHTGGNALFTVELLREMKRRSILEKDQHGRWVTAAAVDWGIMPPRVEGVIETRINRLDPELREWLKSASVEGELFTVEVLARLAQKSEAAVVKRLGGELAKQHHLIRAAGIQRVGSLRLSRYQFRHNLFRHYLYDQLDEIEQSYLNQQVGETLEQLLGEHANEFAGQLAHHFQIAGMDDKTLHYLIQAADEATRLYAVDQAIAYYAQAIEIGQRLSIPYTRLIDIYLKHAASLEILGDFDGSIYQFKKALQLSQENEQPNLEWQALLGLGKSYASHDYLKAGDYYEKALALARQIDDSNKVARSLNRMGNWFSNTNNLQQALEVHESAFEIYRNLQDKQGMADTSDLTSWVYYYRGDFVQAASSFDRAIALYRELDDQAGLSSALANRGSMGAYYEFHPVPSVNPIHESIPSLEESYQIAVDIGWRSQQSYALWSLATRYFASGEFGRGIEAIEKGLEIASEINHKYWITGELYDLGLMYCSLYAVEAARSCLEKALPLSQEIQSDHFSNQINGALAKTFMLQGDFANAHAQLAAVIATDTPMETTSQRFCWALQAELAFLEGEAQLTVEIIDKLTHSIPGVLPDRVVSSLWRLHGDALYSLGHMEQAESILRAALDNALALDEQFILWRIYGSLGRFLKTEKREAEADEALNNARQAVDRLAESIPQAELRVNFSQAASALLEPWKR